MKPPSIDVSDIRALPRLQELVVPVAYRDENEHMNVRYYMTIFDEAGYPMIANLGLTPEFHMQNGTGGFDLEHHLHYLNEILIGDRVAVYYRLLARSAKRLHYMMFLVNETRGNVGATFECVNSFADLRERKTGPYPPEIAARIDAVLTQHQQLAWAAPMCGVLVS
jgi:acyl-CoA thioester hydrolase